MIERRPLKWPSKVFKMLQAFSRKERGGEGERLAPRGHTNLSRPWAWSPTYPEKHKTKHTQQDPHALSLAEKLKLRNVRATPPRHRTCVHCIPHSVLTLWASHLCCLLFRTCCLKCSWSDQDDVNSNHGLSTIEFVCPHVTILENTMRKSALGEY